MAPTKRPTRSQLSQSDSPTKQRMTRSRTAMQQSQSQRATTGAASKAALHRSLPATPSTQRTRTTPPKTNEFMTPAKQQLPSSGSTSASAADENMRVFVRIRPALDVDPLDSSHPANLLGGSGYNIDDLAESPYQVDYANESIHAGGSWFTFDGLHAPSSSSGDIYAAHVSPMVKQSLEGYNASVFAYGSTGSGKTHSLMGNWIDHGIVPRAVEEVYDLIEQDESREYVVRVSYLEIYNETLRDLLADPSNLSSAAPKIHEDKRGRIFVRPLVATPCSTADAVLDLLVRGETRRRVAATEWNAHSSRSHAVFSLTFESRMVEEEIGVPVTPAAVKMVAGKEVDQTPGANFGAGVTNMPITPSVSKFKRSSVNDGSIRISQLNIIDLAGSEKATGDDARNKESGYIKKSLLALQAVVNSLSSSTSSSTTKHIPYRNSQLTRLLQTSLSGNAKLAFLCTISPDPSCEIDTLSTLRFAAGAKKVVTRAEVGKVVDRESLLVALEKRVVELEQALLTNADLTEALERERDEANERADGASKAREEYEVKLAELQNQRTPLKEQHDHLRRLIVTGSPRSPYSQHIHGAEAGLGSGSPIARFKGIPYRPSRLSNVQTPGAGEVSPSKRGSRWRDFLFGTSTVEGEPQAQSQKDNGEAAAKIEELELTVAKLEASLAEAEDTHQGQINDVQEELAAMQEKHDADIAEKEAESETLRRRLAEQEDLHQAELRALHEQLARVQSTHFPGSPLKSVKLEQRPAADPIASTTTKGSSVKRSTRSRTTAQEVENEDKESVAIKVESP